MSKTPPKSLADQKAEFRSQRFLRSWFHGKLTPKQRPNYGFLRITDER